FREKERKYDKIICSYKSPEISCPTKGLSFIKVVNWCKNKTFGKLSNLPKAFISSVFHIFS
ncbi:hypothetical protein, partial [Petralouisia muris]|uniref:hypothetical protein n=1 Tax=Petralouisia muris TaxID=3032872 RepID=UPI0023B77ED4